MYNLSFMLLVKDSAKYLNEWLAYHHSIGVEHFYIINDMSSDSIKEVLEPWINLGIVDMTDYDIDGKQAAIYSYFCRQLNGATKWLGFLDMDEFLVVKNGNAAEWLNTFPEETSSVEINWCCFGSSGLENYENVFVTKRFKKYSNIDFGPNIHVKSIVKLGEDPIFVEPHSISRSVNYARDSNGELVNKRYFLNRKPIWDNAWINHYFCLSKEEFGEKLRRGRADTKDPINARRWQTFEEFDRNECEGENSLEKAEKQIKETLRKLNIM
jgi:hypothetical protein